MKTNCIIAAVLGIFLVIAPGCATFGGNGGNGWTQNTEQVKKDAHNFAKISTMIALNEADLPEQDVEMIRGYLIALKDLLLVPGEPDFGGVTNLVNSSLPEKYRAYGFAISAVAQRFLDTAEIDLTEDQKKVVEIISAVISGALEGLEGFSGSVSS